MTRYSPRPRPHTTPITRISGRRFDNNSPGARLCDQIFVRQFRISSQLVNYSFQKCYFWRVLMDGLRSCFDIESAAVVSKSLDIERIWADSVPEKE